MASARCSSQTFHENGQAAANRLPLEVRAVIYGLLLMLMGLYYPLQLSTGGFPRPLTAQEERHYLDRFAQGDLEARNILIERNLRLVAHIMKKY